MQKEGLGVLIVLDHRSVVETFGEGKEFLGTFMQASVEHK